LNKWKERMERCGLKIRSRPTKTEHLAPIRFTEPVKMKGMCLRKR